MSKFRSKHGARAERYRKARRGVAHAKDAARKNSKHMRRWRLQNDRTGALQDAKTPSRRVAGGHDTGVQVAVESRSTARRPWTVRAENRRRNKAAKASRRGQRWTRGAGSQYTARRGRTRKPNLAKHK